MQLHWIFSWKGKSRLNSWDQQTELEQCIGRERNDSFLHQFSFKSLATSPAKIGSICPSSLLCFFLSVRIKILHGLAFNNLNIQESFYFNERRFSSFPPTAKIDYKKRVETKNFRFQVPEKMDQDKNMRYQFIVSFASRMEKALSSIWGSKKS